MQAFFDLSERIEYCMKTKRFSGSLLISFETPKKIHSHACHEIYLFFSGGKEFFIDDKLYDILPGDVFFISRNEKHHITNPDTKCFKHLSIMVHPAFLQYYSTENLNLATCFENHNIYHPRIHLTQEQLKRFNYLTRKMYSYNGFGSDVLENSTFCELLVMLNYEFYQQNIQSAVLKEQQQSEPIPNSLFYDVLNYINANITRNFSIKELSELFFVSASYICRIFKAGSGMSIKEYVTNRRISLAKSMMEQEVKLSDIYMAVGFTNYNTFYKAFVSVTGSSPQKYMHYDC